MRYLQQFAKTKGYAKIAIKTRNDKKDMIRFLVKNDFNFTSVEEREDIKDNRINLEKIVKNVEES